VSLGLNLQWGKTGLFNAGVAGFMGIGAYTFGMLSTGRFADPVTNWYHAGPPVPFDIVSSALIAMVIAGLFGIAVAIPTLRLRADYLAIATLALAEIVRLILKNERRLTGGDLGLGFVPRPLEGFIPRGWSSDGAFVVVALAATLLVFVVLEFMSRAPWGRALRAVREDEEAAEALGKNAFRLKLSAFGIGCGIMGLAGALQASFNGSVHPDSYAAFATFNTYVVVILGGSGHHRGVILGGYLFYLFGWTSQQLKAYVPTDWALRIDFINQIVIGLLLILFILFRPEGILPEPKYVPRKEA